MPTYFTGVFQVKLADNPVLMSAPYLASWAGAIFFGRLADVLVLRVCRTRHVRKAMQLLGAVLCTIGFQLAARSSHPKWAAIWISASLFFGRAQIAGYWVNMLDVCPERASTVMGISNTIASIPGIVGQPITQAILDGSGGHESNEAWSLVFGVGGCVAVVAALVFLAFADDRNLDDAEGLTEALSGES